MSATHETATDHSTVKSGSDRSFGIVFAIVFVVIALFPLLGNWTAWGEVRLWSLGVAALLFLVALVRPVLLAPANRLWFRFGMLLHKIISPIVLGILFWGVLTPAGLLMRVKNRDPLSTRFVPEQETYWISRDTDGEPSSMENQF